MDYDEFKRRLEAQQKKGFEQFQKAFNQKMREQGRTETLDDVLGEGPSDATPAVLRACEKISKREGGGREKHVEMPPWDEEKSEQLADLFLEIYRETTDEDPRDIVLRAMAVYRSFVVHARAGGQVKFVREGQPDRTLKVRLR